MPKTDSPVVCKDQDGTPRTFHRWRVPSGLEPNPPGFPPDDYECLDCGAWKPPPEKTRMPKQAQNGLDKMHEAVREKGRKRKEEVTC